MGIESLYMLGARSSSKKPLTSLFQLLTDFKSILISKALDQKTLHFKASFKTEFIGRKYSIT